MTNGVDSFVSALHKAGMPQELEGFSRFLYTLRPCAALVVGSACDHVPQTSFSDVDLVVLWEDGAIASAFAHAVEYAPDTRSFSFDYLGPHIQFGYLFVIRNVEERFSLDLGLASCHFFLSFMPGPHSVIWGKMASAPLSPPVQRIAVFEQTICQALKACACRKTIYAVDYLSRARCLSLLIMSSKADFGGMSRQHYSHDEENRLLACSSTSGACIEDILLSIKSLCTHMSVHIADLDTRVERWIRLCGPNATDMRKGGT